MKHELAEKVQRGKPRLRPCERSLREPVDPVRCLRSIALDFQEEPRAVLSSFDKSLSSVGFDFPANSSFSSRK